MTLQTLDPHDAQILGAVLQTSQIASKAALRAGLSRVAAPRRLQQPVEAPADVEKALRRFGAGQKRASRPTVA